MQKESLLDPGSTIGIIGGGQLGRMLAIAARQMDYKTIVLDPDGSPPHGYDAFGLTASAGNGCSGEGVADLSKPEVAA